MHNLDTTNGVVSYAGARKAAWHALGTTTASEMTALEALTTAHLAGWNVRKAPLLFESIGEHRVTIPDQFAVVRDNPIVPGRVDPLGVVGGTYTPMQNEELVGLLDSLVDESGAHFDTAGAIDGGRRVFVSMRLPGHIQVGGVDPVDQYLAAVTGHDGNLATTLMVTPVRIVCQNTLNVALRSHSSVYRVRHTVGAQAVLLAEARAALGFTFAYLDDFAAEAERMLNTPCSDAEFMAIIGREYGAPEDAATATATRAENKLLHLEQLFQAADTQEAVRGTRWAAFNALTEYADHFAPVRGGSSDEEARAKKSVFRPAMKDRALELFGVPA